MGDFALDLEKIARRMEIRIEESLAARGTGDSSYVLRQSCSSRARHVI